LDNPARRAANVLGAVFQVAASPVGGLLAGASVGEVSGRNPTLVVPAGYAFSIWGPIFALCLVYAVWQALPGVRLPGGVGWSTAGAFFLNGVWELVFPFGLFLAAQAVLVGSFLCAGAAYLGLREVGGRAGSWLAALPVGLLFGWLSAATFVGFATTLEGLGVESGVPASCALLLAAGAVAAAASGLRGVPAQGRVACGAAGIWAFAAVVAGQQEGPWPIAAVAVAAAALVALGLAAGLLRRSPARGGANRAWSGGLWRGQ